MNASCKVQALYPACQGKGPTVPTSCHRGPPRDGGDPIPDRPPPTRRSQVLSGSPVVVFAGPVGRPRVSSQILKKSPSVVLAGPVGRRSRVLLGRPSDGFDAPGRRPPPPFAGPVGAALRWCSRLLWEVPPPLFADPVGNRRVKRDAEDGPAASAAIDPGRRGNRDVTAADGHRVTVDPAQKVRARASPTRGRTRLMRGWRAAPQNGPARELRAAGCVPVK